MKKISIALLIIISAFGCFSQQFNEKKLEKFSHKFAKAVMTGRPEKCLPFFEKKYVQEQHDHFLQGNTMQFVSEFMLGFGQLSHEEAGIDLPVFSDISNIVFVNIIRDRFNDIFAAYDVTLKNGRSFRLLAPVVIINKNKFAFIGAYG